MMINWGLNVFQLFIRLSVAIALTFSVMQPALAAKRPTRDTFLWHYHYYGVLGKSTKVSMILGSLPDGQLVGSYSYVKIGTPIKLSGKLAPDLSFDLIEKTVSHDGNIKSEQITGTFLGRFDKSFEEIQGTWSSPDRKKSIPFKLSKGVLVDSKAIDDLPDNHGFLIIAHDISVDSINSFCEVIADTLSDRRSRTSCILADSSSIGDFGGKEYRVVEFEESGIWWNASHFKDSYSVLFEVINNKAKPFWLYKNNDDGSSLYKIEMLRDGVYPVFEATYNSGGTRPAWYGFTIRRPTGFSMIDTNKLEHAVFKIAEDNGYVPHSTLYFDFVKRQASTQLYKPGDPMCCGSAEISLIFEIENDVMVLKDYKINIKQ